MHIVYIISPISFTDACEGAVVDETETNSSHLGALLSLTPSAYMH